MGMRTVLKASYPRSRSNPLVLCGTQGKSSSTRTLVNRAAYMTTAKAATEVVANLNGKASLSSMAKYGEFVAICYVGIGAARSALGDLVVVVRS